MQFQGLFLNLEYVTLNQLLYFCSKQKSQPHEKVYTTPFALVWNVILEYLTMSYLTQFYIFFYAVRTSKMHLFALKMYFQLEFSCDFNSCDFGLRSSTTLPILLGRVFSGVPKDTQYYIIDGFIRSSCSICERINVK